MKKITLFVLMTALGISLFAQQLITQGGLIYKKTQTIRGVEKGSEKISQSYEQFLFNATTVRTLPKSIENIKLFTIKRCNDPLLYTYINNEEEFFFTKEEVNETYILSFPFYDELEAKIVNTTDTATLQNFFCKKINFIYNVDGEEKIIEIWYTTEVKIKTNCIKFFKYPIDGLPVKIKLDELTFKNIKLNTGLESSTEIMLDSLFEEKNSTAEVIEQLNKYEEVDKNEAVQRTLNMAMADREKSRPSVKGEMATRTIKTNNGNETNITFYKPLIKEGEKILAFEGSNLNDETLQMQQYAGKPIVLNFWFTQCAPCIVEMPMLNKVVANYKDKVGFVSITYSTKEEVTNFLKKHAFDFDKIVNAKTLMEKYGITYYPTTVIIDKEGVIRFLKSGAFESEKELTKQLDKLL